MGGQIFPKPRLQHLLRIEKIRRLGRCANSTAGRLLEATEIADLKTFSLFILLIKHAETAQALNQDFSVFGRHRFV
ncbi:hypothetical protein EDD52_1684 [Primorskyibacter sedentarius]|uniref:Uncharacterized protein n=2 Tax=Primorskyibacter sedentarius TaxID=745311 RepID=A0A4R3IFJ0_9RHOB|nr:hypothetical protein EDD52_1684 [Primorskyibacter sedentarius]